MRDHRKLQAFQLADELVVVVYRQTDNMPRHERFGLTAQLRRAALSVASNIVEGCARHSQSDYLRFLDMAYGSARELEYQLSLTLRLGFLERPAYEAILNLATQTCKVLNSLIRSLRHHS